MITPIIVSFPYIMICPVVVATAAHDEQIRVVSQLYPIYHLARTILHLSRTDRRVDRKSPREFLFFVLSSEACGGFSDFFREGTFPNAVQTW